MSSDEALSMSEDCVCRTKRDARILRTIFHRSQIKNRHLCVPHSMAYEWVPVAPKELSDEAAAAPRGPTTSERMELYARHSGTLAICSATAALAAAEVRSNEISHLITVSCTGFDAPGVDVQLIDALGLPLTTERIHVGFMGCHGAINGMRAALAVTKADPHATVLLVATELCSLHFCFNWEPERLLGNALFADGSAALVARASTANSKNGGPSGNGENSDGERIHGATDEDRPWRVVATGSCLFENSRDAITWRIGDHGFEMSLSRDVPDLIEANLRPWMQAWLSKHDLTMEAIGAWAIHPGGPRIVDAVAESLDLAPEATTASREILQTHGNMSSPTVLFILDRLRRDGAKGPCVALGFGPGLVAEAALLD